MLIFEGNRSRPGTHALVVGISRYRHLPGGDGVLATEHFGLHQLTSAARSAQQFAHWLTQEARLPLPLATCRVLLAPSSEEPPLANFVAASGPCDAGAFLDEANNWIADASASEHESAIFYFVGHTLNIPDFEDVLLFEDFGAPRRPLLKGGVSFMNVFRGMASTDTLSGQAQHFFVDGSRHRILADRGSLLSGATNVFDVRLDRVDRRTGGTFYAALAGEQAYARVGGTSLFVDSLLRGLRGAAATRSQTSRGWEVTAGSLANWLALDASHHEAEFGLRLKREFNLRGDSVICELARPSAVPVYLALDPPQAMQSASCQIAANDGSLLFSGDFEGRPLQIELPIGIYAFEITPALPWKPLRVLEFVEQSSRLLTLHLDAAEGTP